MKKETDNNDTMRKIIVDKSIVCKGTFGFVLFWVSFLVGFLGFFLEKKIVRSILNIYVKFAHCAIFTPISFSN